MTLRLNNITKSFSTAAGTAPVLDGVSLEVADGERLALVGASGSGKTTLLRLIAGFERPDSGTIAFGDQELSSPSGFVPAHRRGVGYVAQDGALFPHLTVARNITFGLPRRERGSATIERLMALASLEPALAERMPHELSGGQQQRVALARALALEPRVILLDEPFSALDTGLRAQTRAAVIEVLERSGVTTVLVTHDQHEALSFGHQTGILSQGRLVQAGSPAELFNDPANTGAAAFLGDVVLLPATRVVMGGSTVESTVDSALGRLEVRHDRSEGSVDLVAMLRPEQIRLEPSRATQDPDASARMAVITSVRPLGPSTELTLSCGAGEQATFFAHRLPPHRAAEFESGDCVSIAVDGGVVLYPKPETGAATDSF